MAWNKYTPTFTKKELAAETWRVIPEFEAYEVSDLGRIRRGERIRALVKNPISGYVEVTLSRDNRQIRKGVHRLVVAAHRGPIPEGYHVNHMNMVKDDNRLANLEAVTAAENYAHAAKNNVTRGEAVNTAKLTEGDVRKIRLLAREGVSTTELMRIYGLGRPGINGVISRRSWKHVE